MPRLSSLAKKSGPAQHTDSSMSSLNSVKSCLCQSHSACDLQDKILQSMGRGQEVTVTNDGATILKSLYVDNPAAKVLVGM